MHIISNAPKRVLIFPGYDSSIIIFLNVAVGWIPLTSPCWCLWGANALATKGLTLVRFLEQRHILLYYMHVYQNCRRRKGKQASRVPSMVSQYSVVIGVIVFKSVQVLTAAVYGKTWWEVSLASSIHPRLIKDAAFAWEPCLGCSVLFLMWWWDWFATSTSAVQNASLHFNGLVKSCRYEILSFI